MERVFRSLKTEWIPSMGCPTMEGAKGSLANVEVAGSNPVSRSKLKTQNFDSAFFLF